jgi:hypothetical protein
VEGADKGRSHTHIDTSGIVNSEDEELRDLEGEVAKSRTPKFRYREKYDHIVWSGGDWNLMLRV